VHRERVRDHVRERRERARERASGPERSAARSAKTRQEFVAVLGAEAAGVEVEQRAVDSGSRRLRAGVSPRARARRTSVASRRISARATAVPNGVSR
jgi:hypothetical protein